LLGIALDRFILPHGSTALSNKDGDINRTKIAKPNVDLEADNGNKAKIAAPDPILGTWVWFDTNEAVISADGTIFALGRNMAKWKRGRFSYDGKEYSYNLVWDTGFIDHLNLEDGDRRLEGVNMVGGHVHAQRK
jgi:hypothetical protein